MVGSLLPYAKPQRTALEKCIYSGMSDCLVSSRRAVARLGWYNELEKGSFRLWLAGSLIWLACVSAYFAINFSIPQFDRTKPYSIVIPVVPTDCEKARGQRAIDYQMRDGSCWYQMPTFRRLFPEYKDLSDDVLATKLFEKFGPIQTNKPSSVERYVSSGAFYALIGLGVPLCFLAFGITWNWVYRGFS